MIVRSQMSLIMDVIGLERLELFELEKLLHLNLFTLQMSTNQFQT